MILAICLILVGCLPHTHTHSHAVHTLSTWILVFQSRLKTEGSFRHAYLDRDADAGPVFVPENKLKAYQLWSSTEAAMQYQSRKAIRIPPRLKHGCLGKITRTSMRWLALLSKEWVCSNSLWWVCYSFFFSRGERSCWPWRWRVWYLSWWRCYEILILFWSLCLTTPADVLRIGLIQVWQTNLQHAGL